MDIKLFSHRILSKNGGFSMAILGEDTDGEMMGYKWNNHENRRIQPSTVGIPMGISGINCQPWDLSHNFATNRTLDFRFVDDVLFQLESHWKLGIDELNMFPFLGFL
jgi:hypothetical protein